MAHLVHDVGEHGGEGLAGHLHVLAGRLGPLRLGLAWLENSLKLTSFTVMFLSHFLHVEVKHLNPP